jgi:hypothetical protein
MVPKESEHRKAYRRNWHNEKYNNDPKYRKKVNETAKKNIKLRFAEHYEAIFQFKNQGCRKCRAKDYDVLCAHHRNPKGKLFNIGSFVAAKPTPEELKRELGKCDCLCLNCHAKLHIRLREEDGR